jgi:hypothetical protein
MSFLAREWRIRINTSIKITRHNVFDHSSEDNVVRFAVRQLDPIINQTISYPKYSRIYTFASNFNSSV